MLLAVEALRIRTDRVAVMLSGKDSLCAMIACLDAGLKIEAAVHMYFTPGLRCIIDPLREAADICGVPFIEVPHYDMARCRHFGVLSIPDPAWPRNLVLRDVHQLVRKRLGVDWVVEGLRRSECNAPWHSLRMLRAGGLLPGPVCQAIFDQSRSWVAAQFEHGGICNARGIGRPDPIGGRVNHRYQSGWAFTGLHMAWLRGRCRHLPSCFDMVCDAWPFAKATLLRAEKYGEPMGWAR